MEPRPRIRKFDFAETVVSFWKVGIVLGAGGAAIGAFAIALTGG